MKNSSDIAQFPWAEIISKYRSENESVRSFCSRMGLNHHIFRSWEKGEKPSVKSLNKIKDNLSMSYEDYRELLRLCHNVEPTESTYQYAHVEKDGLEPTDLPYTYFCKRLFFLKPRNESSGDFLERLEISPQEWMEWMREPQPNIRMDRLWSIFTRLGYDKSSQMIRWLLTDDCPLEEVEREVKRGRKNANSGSR